MSGYPRLDETGLNTLAEALANATEQQGVIKVCETEAEWNQKSQAEKDDPNIYWFLPWRTSTSGEINDNTIASDKVWSSQKVNSENTALKAMVTDDYVFSPTKAYVAGDWLIHNNILYEVLVACTGVTPPNATYYAVKTLHDLQSEIDTLNSKLAIQNGSVTYVPGKSTSASISLVKSGNVCSLTIINGSFTASANETFAEIPEGFRPNGNVDYLDSYNKYRIQISRNGEMSSFTALSSTVIRGSVTYITNH